KACNLAAIFTPKPFWCRRVSPVALGGRKMKLLKKFGRSISRMTVLGTALMGGFLAFLGAGTASAHPRVYVGVGIGGPVVVRGGYYTPAPYWRPVYVRPRYGYRARLRARHPYLGGGVHLR